MTIRSLLLAVVCLPFLTAQTAQFPGAVASDSHLKVAANFVQTALRGRIGPGDTVITVQDASDITANMLLTIDKEVVSVTSKSGNDLTVERGFDNTAAAPHASGARVWSVPTAWDKNVLAKEIQAIESALGPGLSGISADGATNVRYNFQPQTPGGSLIVGANVITMAPCPQGLSGSNSGHDLRISGGVGTAETVRITGGSCTSGATSGTVIFTAANTHSGAWQIASATAGVTEAVYASGKTSVLIPPGDYTIYGTIPCFSGLNLHGKGATSILRAGRNPMTMIACSGPGLSNVVIRDMQLIGADWGGGGANAIVGISMVSGVRETIENLTIDNVRYAIHLDRISDSFVQNIHLWNHSTIYSGSTVVGVADYAFNNTISHVTHRATVPLTFSDAIITLERAATNTVSDFYSPNLFEIAVGVRIKGDSQANAIRAGNIVSPSIGIHIDCTSAYPGAWWTTLDAAKVDQYGVYGVFVEGPCLYTQINQLLITGKNTGTTEQHGVYIGQGSYGTQVIGSTFMNVHAGVALTVDTNAQGVNLIGNNFANYSPAVGIQLLAGVNKLAMIGNVKDSTDTSTWLIDFSTPSEVERIGNSGMTDVRKNNIELQHANAGIVIGDPTGASTPFFRGRSSGLNTQYDSQIAFSGGTSTPGEGSLSLTARFAVISRYLQFSGLTHALLGTPPNGVMIWCSDCTRVNPCGSGGTGAFAKRENGVWRCD